MLGRSPKVVEDRVAHDDFIAPKPPTPPKKKGGRPEHGVRGFAIQFADGTCALIDFDKEDPRTGWYQTDVWIVGERPPPGHVRGCKKKDTNSGLARLGDKRGTSVQGTYACIGANKIGISTR